MSAGGMLVSMMDGSCRNVTVSVSIQTLAKAFIPNDGMPLPDDWN